MHDHYYFLVPLPPLILPVYLLTYCWVQYFPPRDDSCLRAHYVGRELDVMWRHTGVLTANRARPHTLSSGPSPPCPSRLSITFPGIAARCADVAPSWFTTGLGRTCVSFPRVPGLQHQRHPLLPHAHCEPCYPQSSLETNPSPGLPGMFRSRLAGKVPRCLFEVSHGQLTPEFVHSPPPPPLCLRYPLVHNSFWFRPSKFCPLRPFGLFTCNRDYNHYQVNPLPRAPSLSPMLAEFFY